MGQHLPEELLKHFHTKMLSTSVGVLPVTIEVAVETRISWHCIFNLFWWYCNVPGRWSSRQLLDWQYVLKRSSFWTMFFGALRVFKTTLEFSLNIWIPLKLNYKTIAEEPWQLATSWPLSKRKGRLKCLFNSSLLYITWPPSTRVPWSAQKKRVLLLKQA